MADLRSFLPANATPFEQVNETIEASRRPFPTDVIKSVWNPQTCPLELLPYLAWGLGLEIWDDTWSEQKKREVTANIWWLKSKKTTLAGISAYVDMVGGQVVSARRPRDKIFAVRSMSNAEQAAQMALMPKIHIYPAALSAPADIAKAFFSGPIFRSFFDGKIAEPSNAAMRFEQRAFYLDQGTTVPVYVTGTDQTLDAGLTVALTTDVPQAKMFFSMCWSGHCLMSSDAQKHVLTLTPQNDALSFAVPLGLVPTAVRPVRIYQTSSADYGKMFAGWSYFGQSYAEPSDAELLVYDEITLFDATRLFATHRARSFWGWSKFGLAPYQAELRLSIPIPRPIWAFGAYWGVGVWLQSDLSPLWDAMQAIRISQASRDDISVSTLLYEPVSFETGLSFGTFDFGDYRKAA